jgi:LmbE family N-acetylglucosaminyl deacetylase
MTGIRSHPGTAMIPIVSEKDWRRRLTSLPRWQPPPGHALVIAPHPDDETLAAGGLIAHLRSQGARVTVIAVTDGENAYPDMPNLADSRQREQTQALARLGVSEVDVHRLRLPDSGVEQYEDQLVQALLEIATEGRYLVAPWRGDFHPDHEACGRAAEGVSKALGIPLFSYFFWTWHRGELRVLDGLNLAIFPLSEEGLIAKREALHCHQSQLHHESGHPILPNHLLEPVERPYEVFLLP